MTNLSPFTGLDYNLNNSFIAFNLLPSYYKYLTNFQLLQVSSNGSQIFWDNKFLKDRDVLMQQTYITGSTITLEAYLNELFDTTERRIEIINASSQLNPIFLYKKGENGNVDSQTFTFNKSENGNNSYIYRKNEVILEFDFKIRVPNELISLGLDINQLKAIVDKYKTVGTIYTIEYFS